MIVIRKQSKVIKNQSNRCRYKKLHGVYQQRPLYLELLEQRSLLAADLMVNTIDDLVDGDVSSITALIEKPGDDGLISLREAVLATNVDPGLDTILFADNLDGLPLTLSLEGRDENASATGDLDITDDLIIQGRGKNNTIIDARNIDRVFEITSASTTVSFSGITLRSGEANSGGGVSNHGKLSIFESTISSNHAIDTGGGIYNRGTIQNITDSTVSGNSTNGRGGGIHNTGTIENISQSTISGNQADFLGGGLFNTSRIVSISESTISGNMAGQDGGGIHIYEQGGNSGGAIIEEISSSTLFGNTADNGSAIYNGSSLVRLSDSTIAENNAADPNGSTIYNFGIMEELQMLTINDNEGRGIGNRGTIPSISHTIIFGNHSQQDGGGLFNFVLNSIEKITFSMIYGNESEQNGGGISNRGALGTISNSLIFGNEASENGGGLTNEELGTIGNITNSTISDNSAKSGGGIYNSATIQTITNSTIPDNFSELQGAGIENNQGTIAQLISTIIANNTTTNGNSDLSNQGTLSFAGYNLIESPDGHTLLDGIENNIVGADPMLGVLDDHGGPTLTHALLLGSPAIDSGNESSLEFDQRGEPFDRTFGDSSDIGAFERQPDFQINPFPYQNPDNQFDVDDNGIVNSLDLLRLIRDLNSNGNRQLPLTKEESSPYVDVNGDNIENPLDIVILVTELNRLASTEFANAIEEDSLQISASLTGPVETIPTPSSHRADSSSKIHPQSDKEIILEYSHLLEVFYEDEPPLEQPVSSRQTWDSEDGIEKDRDRESVLDGIPSNSPFIDILFLE